MTKDLTNQHDSSITENLDPIAKYILEFLSNQTNSSGATFEKIAKSFYTQHFGADKKPLSDQDKRAKTISKDAWRKYLNPVKQQSIFLARNNFVVLKRRGEDVDPNNFRGLVKVNLPNN